MYVFNKNRVSTFLLLGPNPINWRKKVEPFQGRAKVHTEKETFCPQNMYYWKEKLLFILNGKTTK
jgi:hypothetical protein